jgi:hypothetical protein
MRVIPDQLRSKNLVPFKKRVGRYKIPGMTSEDEILMDQVDPDLSPEEQSYVRHYLGYADALIRSAQENALPDRLPESPRSSNEGQQHQPPADQPASPAKYDRPARAA